jgi:hypothetical protein
MKLNFIAKLLNYGNQAHSTARIPFSLRPPCQVFPS